jgi:hypothetical protein
MPIADYINKSTSKPRFIIQLSLNKFNSQWVNIGSGIWKVNFDATYPEVESWLLPVAEFFAQDFGEIGMVTSDYINELTESSTLLALSSNTNMYYYNGIDTIYIRLTSNDDPILHTIQLGVISGYSFRAFTPVDSLIPYEGRLTGSPSIAISRDPLFFGKLQYSFGGFDLINTDGFFDLLAQENDVYGNLVSILFGYEELPISEYICLSIGIVEKITTSETIASFTIADRRKSLSKSVTYSCTNKNALEVIEELLSINYFYPYTSDYYDITNWEAAKALAPNATIDIGVGKTITDMKVQEIIEMVCSSSFGSFLIDKDGKFSFKMIDPTATATSIIESIDLLNTDGNKIEYSPNTIISSTKVGHSKSWAEDYTSPYTWLVDTSKEADSYKKYKIYNQKEFTTILTNVTDAQTFSDKILAYFKDIHGTGTIIVPMKYYNVEIADTINIEINRMKKTMLGTKKCEIMGIAYKLATASIEIKYRIV